MDDGRKAVAVVPRRMDDARDVEDDDEFEDNCDLPGLLGEIADIAGREVARKLAEARGGTRIDIPAPKKVGKDHWLSELLGYEEAQRLSRAFAFGAGEDLHLLRSTIQHEVLPMGPFSDPRYLARERLVEALHQGIDVRTAARFARVHERTAWRMKAKMNKALPRRTEGNS